MSESDVSCSLGASSTADSRRCALLLAYRLAYGGKHEQIHGALILP
ncbi:hypothetical protein [Streptomyces sp. NPDC059757]